MYAPSDVSISKALACVPRGLAAVRRLTAVGHLIGVQLRYPRHELFHAPSPQDAIARARRRRSLRPIAIWTVAVDADDADAVLHHHRRRARRRDVTGGSTSSVPRETTAAFLGAFQRRRLKLPSKPDICTDFNRLQRLKNKTP